MSDSGDKVTNVEIYNHTYGIRGNDPDYVRRLAEVVDQKMCEVAEYTPTVDTAKVAILAALNIADDYISCLDKLNHLEEQIIESSKKISAKLEPALSSETS
jgi:cell division protein ZapA